jgi:hypothetical protein
MVERTSWELGDRLRRKEGATAKPGMWENVCPTGEGPYTKTPASKITC